MLTCIACSKQLNTNNGGSKEEDDIVLGTPRSKQTIKSLTSQIKEMAVKASGAYKSCKPCSGSSNRLFSATLISATVIVNRLATYRPHFKTGSMYSLSGFDDWEMQILHTIQAYEARHLLTGEGENPEETQLPLLLRTWLGRLTPVRSGTATMICLGMYHWLLRWKLMLTREEAPTIGTTSTSVEINKCPATETCKVAKNTSVV